MVGIILGMDKICFLDEKFIHNLVEVLRKVEDNYRNIFNPY